MRGETGKEGRALLPFSGFLVWNEELGGDEGNN